ncbi:Tad domain-containing protein [Nocardioides sp. Root151]|uniref:Tad domain-containing protein n=1 Tax=Nocardioides sp. Root151 TaxID=1736475 RepID=UPI0007034FC2|nr:Tad domain-containing protein [Nocardioides sp. Root151]KQZ67284.1 hypothetical protein ASD66_20175 [Nocardioides sp. Root151]
MKSFLGLDRPRGERGASAVLFALLALVLLGVGAVAVDMGQVYAKRASLQSAVDQAVLAAAPEIDGTNVCTPLSKEIAAEYLLKNWIDQGGDPKALGDIKLDGTLKGGNVKCSGWRIELTAPVAKVNFGLAKAVSDVDSVNVPAFAAAEVKSPPRNGNMPFYASSTCNYGQQILSQDSNGHGSPPVIPLTPTTPTLTNASPTGLSTSLSPVGTSLPGFVITGTNLTGVTKVGFTNASGDHWESPGGGTTMTVNSNTKITVSTVPSDVINNDDIWYVRVFKDNKWSATDGNATSGVKKLTIGDEKLFCQGSEQGNFGSLYIDRNDGKTAGGGPNGMLALNVALGLSHSLGTMPGAPNAPNLCSGVAGAIQTATNGQNCLSTDTGLPANALGDGLINGVSGYPGRLVRPATSPCSRPNTSVGGKSLNDDVLSCFFTNSSVRVGDVTQASYDGGPVISPDIFKSPRFLWVPIITEAPNGKKDVSVQGFRPGFITDQPASATKNSPGTVPTENGIDLNGTKVRELRVWFLNEKALPDTALAEGGESEYTGTGAKVIVLVD